MNAPAPAATQGLVHNRGNNGGGRPKGSDLTPQRYDLVLNAYRRYPAGSQRHKLVANAVGMHPDSVARIYEKGWVNHEWAKPIKDVLLADQRARRKAELNASVPSHATPQVPDPVTDIAQTVSAQDKEREVAAQARAQEARLIGTARGNVIALQAILAKCLRGGLNLADQIEQHFRTGEVSPREAFRFINRMGELVSMGATSSKAVLEAERLRVGLPQAIIGLVPAEGLTPDQAAHDILRAHNAMLRAQRMGIVTLPSGAMLPASSVIDIEPGSGASQPSGPQAYGLAPDKAAALDTLFADQ